MGGAARSKNRITKDLSINHKTFLKPRLGRDYIIVKWKANPLTMKLSDQPILVFNQDTNRHSCALVTVMHYLMTGYILRNVWLGSFIFV